MFLLDHTRPLPFSSTRCWVLHEFLGWLTVGWSATCSSGSSSNNNTRKFLLPELATISHSTFFLPRRTLPAELQSRRTQHHVEPTGSLLLESCDDRRHTTMYIFFLYFTQEPPAHFHIKMWIINMYIYYIYIISVCVITPPPPPSRSPPLWGHYKYKYSSQLL